MGKYIVTGAAGHLGSTILRELCRRNCEVHALLLPGQEAKITGPGIHYLYGDVCKKESVRPLFEQEGIQETICIHTAAIISIARKMPPGLYHVNVDGVKNILSLCEEYHIKRLVHVSSVHAIPELPDGRTMGEIDSFSADCVRGGYAKTKAEAAQAVMDAARNGLNAVVVFPSGIIGPYDEGGEPPCPAGVLLYAGQPACLCQGRV